jgi:hypothetical protein
LKSTVAKTSRNFFCKDIRKLVFLVLRYIVTTSKKLEDFNGDYTLCYILSFCMIRCFWEYRTYWTWSPCKAGDKSDRHKPRSNRLTYFSSGAPVPNWIEMRSVMWDTETSEWSDITSPNLLHFVYRTHKNGFCLQWNTHRCHGTKLSLVVRVMSWDARRDLSGNKNRNKLNSKIKELKVIDVPKLKCYHAPKKQLKNKVNEQTQELKLKTFSSYLKLNLNFSFINFLYLCCL